MSYKFLTFWRVALRFLQLLYRLTVKSATRHYEEPILDITFDSLVLLDMVKYILVFVYTYTAKPQGVL